MSATAIGTPGQKSMLQILLEGLQPKPAQKSRRGRPPKQQVCQEGEGWGATVAPGTRYIYSSRTRAREGKLTDQVGQNGRIA